jgi:SAM-dependent methyltransferase
MELATGTTAGEPAVRTVELDGIQYEVYSPLQRCLNTAINPFRNYLLPAALLKALLRRSDSPLIQETFERPGGWQSMRIIYENAEPRDMFDRLAVSYNSVSMEVRNRRRLVTRLLTDIIRCFSNVQQLQILGVGSGLGVQIHDAIQNADVQDRVTAYLVDLDPLVVESGRKCADERGLAQVVDYRTCDARQIETAIPDFHPHVVKIVGLLEYLTDEQALELLTKMHDVLADDGKLVTHGMVDRYGVAPFFERTFGMRHHKRPGDHIDRLLTQAGFTEIERSETPMGIYPIRVATKAGG